MHKCGASYWPWCCNIIVINYWLSSVAVFPLRKLYTEKMLVLVRMKLCRQTDNWWKFQALKRLCEIYSIYIHDITFGMLQVRENEISLHKRSGNTAYLRSCAPYREHWWVASHYAEVGCLRYRGRKNYKVVSDASSRVVMKEIASILNQQERTDNQKKLYEALYRLSSLHQLRLNVLSGLLVVLQITSGSAFGDSTLGVLLFMRQCYMKLMRLLQLMCLLSTSSSIPKNPGIVE